MRVQNTYRYSEGSGHLRVLRKWDFSSGWAENVYEEADVKIKFITAQVLEAYQLLNPVKSPRATVHFSFRWLCLLLFCFIAFVMYCLITRWVQMSFKELSSFPKCSVPAPVKIRCAISASKFLSLCDGHWRATRLEYITSPFWDWIHPYLQKAACLLHCGASLQTVGAEPNLPVLLRLGPTDLRSPWVPLGLLLSLDSLGRWLLLTHGFQPLPLTACWLPKQSLQRGHPFWTAGPASTDVLVEWSGYRLWCNMPKANTDSSLQNLLACHSPHFGQLVTPPLFAWHRTEVLGSFWIHSFFLHTRFPPHQKIQLAFPSNLPSACPLLPRGSHCGSLTQEDVLLVSCCAPYSPFSAQQREWPC